MALRLGDIMEELSQHDYYTHDGQDAVPAWVRAHFILEQQMVQQRAGEGSVPQTAVRAGVDDKVLQSLRSMYQHAGHFHGLM
jgi:hypothetical protein